MPSMTKKVNVTTTIPVRTVTPPLSGTYKGIIMTTGDILKCISRKAIVDEILLDGTTIRLTHANYYHDNGAGLDALERESINRNEDTGNAEGFNNQDKLTEVETAEVEGTSIPCDISTDNKEITNMQNQVPEAPAVETEEAPVVEIDTTESEPEASVKSTVDAEIAQATIEPPVEEETPKLSKSIASTIKKNTTSKKTQNQSIKKSIPVKKPIEDNNSESDSDE